MERPSDPGHEGVVASVKALAEGHPFAAKFALAGAALVALVTYAGVTAAEPADEADAAVEAAPVVVVAGVVDGDTIDVTRDEEKVRVRLLNVDAPETVDPEGPVECMGPAAAKFLTELLPVGTEVRLEYDVDRRDEYGRELAGVFKDGTLVNAEIARRGLGVAVVYEPNDRFYPRVLEAQQEGVLAGRGMYSRWADCTIPAATDEYVEIAEELEHAAEDVSSYTDEALLAYLAMRDEADARYRAVLRAVGDRHPDSFPFLSFSGITEDTAERYRYDNQEVVATINSATSAIEVALRTFQWTLDQREASREREQKEAESAERRASWSERSGSTSSGSGSGSDSSSGGGGSSSGDGGYTGCRAYDPGGKTWKPIDC